MKKLTILLLSIATLSCESTKNTEEELIQSLEEFLFESLEEPADYERIANHVLDTVHLEEGRQEMMMNRADRAERYQSRIGAGNDYYKSLRDRELKRFDSLTALGVRRDYFLVVKLDYKLSTALKKDSIHSSLFKVIFNDDDIITDIKSLIPHFGPCL